MNFKKQKIKFCLIVIFLSVFCIFPQIVLAAQNEQAAITITLEDVYQEIKEMREEVATKEELAKAEQNLQAQINNVREEVKNVRYELGGEITAIWQTMVGLIVALVVTLLGVKYFVFQADIEKTKNSLLQSDEFKLQIKDYIKDIINGAKRIL
ncbi:MAG: hypothetical protein V1688_01915 [bacterium]